MAELKKTHWKKEFNPQFLGEWDFEPGKDLVAKITKVEPKKITNPKGQSEEKLVMEFEGLKPLILNKTNAESCSKALESPYIEDWAGQYVQMYVTRVAAFNTVTNAIRIREFKPQIK